MDSFSEEATADLTRNRNRSLHGDEPSAHSEQQKCFYCDREGGSPFLMTGDGELHCSRCFEDFTPAEFLAWLQDSPLIVEYSVCGSAQKSVQGWRLVPGCGAAGVLREFEGCGVAVVEGIGRLE